MVTENLTPMKKILQSSCVLLALAVATACSSEGTTTKLDATPNVDLVVPEFLRNAPFINQNNLSPRVTFPDGTLVSINQGTGSITLEANATYEIRVVWVEAFPNGDLPLAQTINNIKLIVAGDGSVTQAEDPPLEYDIDLDFDDDGVSNLAELSAGTDPFVDENSTLVPDNEVPGPVTDGEGGEEGEGPGNNETDQEVATVSLDEIVPTDIRSASVIDLADLSLVLTHPNGSSESFEQGTTVAVDLPLDTTSKVTLTWVEKYEDRDLPLARRTQDVSVGRDGSVELSNATGYSIDLDFDDDGKANLRERINGTDPFAAEEESVAATVVYQPVADVIVPRISKADAPEIDGKNVILGADGGFSGQWAQAVQTDISGAPLTIENLMIDQGAESTDGKTFRRWAAVHDGEHLYVVVIVDDNGERQRDSSNELHNDDSLELFLDVDNSKSLSFGRDDYHRIFPMRAAGRSSSKIGVSDGEVDGPNSSRGNLVIDFATGPDEGPEGVRRARQEHDVYELKLDLKSVSLTSDAAFGFELQINDDDDGGDRDSKWGWKNPSREAADRDDTASNPSFMGTIVLE